MKCAVQGGPIGQTLREMTLRVVEALQNRCASLVSPIGIHEPALPVVHNAKIVRKNGKFKVLLCLFSVSDALQEICFNGWKPLENVSRSYLATYLITHLDTLSIRLARKP